MQQPDAIAALSRADVLLARSDISAREHLRALELAAGARGQLLDAEGEVADIGYLERYQKTLTAIKQEGNAPELMQALSRLPSPARGACPDRQRVRTSRTGLRRELRFTGGEDAIVYVRLDPVSPLHLRIETREGLTICDKRRSSGRAICRWSPAADQTVLVTVQSKSNVAAELAGAEPIVRLFTN